MNRLEKKALAFIDALQQHQEQSAMEPEPEEIPPMPKVKQEDRSDFVRSTITLPPEIYALLAREITQRKIRKEREPTISAVIREALVIYLDRPEARA